MFLTGAKKTPRDYIIGWKGKNLQTTAGVDCIGRNAQNVLWKWNLTRVIRQKVIGSIKMIDIQEVLNTVICGDTLSEMLTKPFHFCIIRL